MKNLSSILSILAFAGVLVLFGLYFSSGKKSGSSESGMANRPAGAFRMAHVDIDSFEAHYDYLKNKKDSFKKRMEQMQTELQYSAKQYQMMAQEFQRKVQSGNISQTEGEATQKKLLQMEKSLQLRDQSLSDELMQEQEKFNKSLQEELADFLKEYNIDKKYDYIISYTSSISLMLYANPVYNITDDVIKGMNERSQKSARATQKK